MMAEVHTSGGGSEPRVPDESEISPPRLPREVPEFFCACRRPARIQTSGTARNPGRRFISCYSGRDICKVWVWEDLVQQYVEKMVDYYAETTHGVIKIEEMAKAREELETREKQINDLRLELQELEGRLKCVAKERDTAIEELAKAREEFKKRDMQNNDNLLGIPKSTETEDLENLAKIKEDLPTKLDGLRISANKSASIDDGALS